MSTSLRLIGSQVPPTDLRSRPRSWSTVRGNRFGAAVTTPHGHSDRASVPSKECPRPEKEVRAAMNAMRDIVHGHRTVEAPASEREVALWAV